ncbi:NADPH-dependent oxidoreductase [Spongorhabdus nitratireducens]
MKQKDVIQLLQNRASVRDFEDKPVNPEILQTILDAARQAPTASNVQAYSLVVVQQQDTRNMLAELSGGQAHIAKAPVFIAVCADLYRLEQLLAASGEHLQSGLCDLELTSVIDASLVGMSASLAANSLGLGSVMIGGIRNHPVQAAELLNLPDKVFCAFGLCLGWPIQTPPAKPRLPQEAVVFNERYQQEFPTAAVQQYDTMLAEHHQYSGFAAEEQWSKRMVKQLSQPRRKDLNEQLKQLGFLFS